MSKALSKDKILYYRRARWDKQEKVTLEKLLVEAHTVLTTRGQRTFSMVSGYELVGARVKISDDGLFLQIASNVPNQPTSTINKDKSVASATIAEEPAPEGKDFLEGDIFVLVKDNHVILCPSGIRENNVTSYFKKALKSAKLKINSDTLELCKIADANKVSMIKNEGVKELRLSSSLYHASLIEMDKANSKPSGLLSSISTQLTRIFSKDSTLKEISELENLNVDVVLSFDGNEGRKKHLPPKFGEAGRERLLKTAEMILTESDDDEGFEIITGKKNKISSDQIRVAENATIRTLGKSHKL